MLLCLGVLTRGHLPRLEWTGEDVNVIIGVVGWSALKGILDVLVGIFAIGKFLSSESLLTLMVWGVLMLG